MSDARLFEWNDDALRAVWWFDPQAKRLQWQPEGATEPMEPGGVDPQYILFLATELARHDDDDAVLPAVALGLVTELLCATGFETSRLSL